MLKYLFAVMIICSMHPAFCQKFMVGASSRDINPDEDSLYMAGGKPNRLFIDVHDSLYVKAFYVSDEREHIVILTFDCIGLMYPELQKIREEIKKTNPSINPYRIVMSSTHTHAGPDVVGIWGRNLSESGINEKHINKMIAMAVSAINEAYAKRQLCTIEYAEGKFGEDWVKNISEPNEIDRTVSVLRCINNDQQIVATLTNFACHPTIMDDATTSASADYVWGYYHYLDSTHGGINMFLQGAIGGWIQPEDVPSSFDNAFYYGRLLGKYSQNILVNAKKNTNGNIKFKSISLSLPNKNKGFLMLSKAGVIKRNFEDGIETEIATFSIGDAQFATHPGETVPAMSIQTRALMKRPGPKFIMGLSQDALGYIIKPSFFIKENKIPHSEYLTEMSIGPDAMKLIMEALKSIIPN